MDDIEINGLSQLNVFLLALVEFGLTTPYDLLSKAGLGSGLTSPALKRLKEAGLLTSTHGPRNRQRYAITDKGKNALRLNLDTGSWRLWQQGQTDIFESLARGIILAWLHPGIDGIRCGISEAEHKLSVLNRKRQMDAEELRASMLRLKDGTLNQGQVEVHGLLIATAYSWLKAECDATLFRLQFEATGEIKKLIEGLPSAPKVILTATRERSPS
jgi:DNA-binding PadR family transcriptional regulator